MRNIDTDIQTHTHTGAYLISLTYLFNDGVICANIDTDTQQIHVKYNPGTRIIGINIYIV